MDFEDLKNILSLNIELRESYIGTLESINIRFRTAVYHDVLKALKDHKCSNQEYLKLCSATEEYVSNFDDYTHYDDAVCLLNSLRKIKYDESGGIVNRNVGEIDGLNFKEIIEKIIQDELLWRLTKFERSQIQTLVDDQFMSDVAGDLGMSEDEWNSPTSLYSYTLSEKINYFMIVECVWANLHPNDPLDQHMESDFSSGDTE